MKNVMSVIVVMIVFAAGCGGGEIGSKSSQASNSACKYDTYKCDGNSSYYCGYAGNDLLWILSETCRNGCNSSTGKCKSANSNSGNSSNNEVETRTANCQGLPANAEWNTVSTITQTWSGSSWLPFAQGIYDENPSTKECHFKCKKNYSWKSGACKADSRVSDCTGLPDNAEWNTVSTITQTWNCSSWQPSTNGKYNKTPSSTECRFKCVEDYFWNGSTCIDPCESDPCRNIDNSTGGCESIDLVEYKCECSEGFIWNGSACIDPCSPNPCRDVENSTRNCNVDENSAGLYSCECYENYTWNSSISTCKAATKTYTCTGLPANAAWNTVSSYTQTWNGSAWSPAASTATYNTTASTTQCRFKCKTNYNWNSSTLTCDAATQSANCTGLPANAEWNTVSTITQTWNGSSWQPTTTGSFSNTASTTECRYKCKKNYTLTNSVCKADSKVSNCTGLPADAHWNTASTISQTWNGSAWAPATTGSYNETPSTSECRFKCDDGYVWNGSECILPECSSSNTGPCYDPTNHLTWSAKALSIMTWNSAVSYCSGLTEGGYSDWHLPNIDELKMLLINVDRVTKNCRVSETNDCLAFSCWSCSSCTTGTQNSGDIYCSSWGTSFSDGRYSKFGEPEPLWSSSVMSDHLDSRWYIEFSDGSVYDGLEVYEGLYQKLYVRCVR